MHEEKLNYFINYVYEYSTPHGILKNNLPQSELSNIFKESLEKRNDIYYDDLFYPYLNDKNHQHLENTFFNFHHYHDLNATSEDHTHLYIIQDYKGDEFNLNPKFIERMMESDVYYILFYNKTIKDIDKFKEGITKLKKEFLITKKHICLITESDLDSTNNDFLYFKIDEHIFEGTNFIDFVKENLAYKH